MKTTSSRQQMNDGPAEANGIGHASQTVHAAEDDVARRAFQLYEQRGCEPGRDLDDWLQAEQDRQRRHSAT